MQQFKIGERIRQVRVSRGYSQQYMAFQLEITQAAYSKIECDQTSVSLSKLYEIAEIFEISPFELMPKPKFSPAINLLKFPQTLKKLFGRRRKST